MIISKTTYIIKHELLIYTVINILINTFTHLRIYIYINMSATSAEQVEIVSFVSLFPNSSGKIIKRKKDSFIETHIPETVLMTVNKKIRARDGQVISADGE